MPTAAWPGTQFRFTEAAASRAERERERSTDASSLGYGPAESGRLGSRDSVVSALAQCAGNQTQAARVLGVSRRTLVKRLEEFALPRPRKQMP